MLGINFHANKMWLSVLYEYLFGFLEEGVCRKAKFKGFRFYILAKCNFLDIFLMYHDLWLTEAEEAAPGVWTQDQDASN